MIETYDANFDQKNLRSLFLVVDASIKLKIK